jgi:menaquinone-9 beta-reductase
VTRRDTDIAVIGAGPGGSTCAALLAERGYDVTLIDQHSFPRDKPCGDGLAPDAVTALRQLGLQTFLAGCQQIGGYRTIVDHRQERLRRFTGTQAVCVPRTRLDKALLDLAVERGAHFITGRALNVALGDGGAAPSVGLASGSGLDRISAQRVIASDGATSTMRRSAGLGTPGHAVRAWAIRGYYATERSLNDLFDIYVPLEIWGTTTVGYGWVFPIDSHVANIGVGYLRPRGPQAMPRLNDALDVFVDELRLREARRYGDIESLGRGAGSPLGVRFTPARSTTTALLLVGDAAGTTDPLTGEGIGPALQSARSGASSVSNSLERGTRLATYGRELGRQMPRAGQDFSCISRIVANRNGAGDFRISELRRSGFLLSAIEMVLAPARPNLSSTALISLLDGMEGLEGLALEMCADELLDAIRTTFPFATPMMAWELCSGAGLILSATLICGARAFGERSSQSAALGAVAVECLAPASHLISLTSDEDDGDETASLNDALATLTADFAMTRALAAAAALGPRVAIRLARTVRDVSQGGLCDANDRYDLTRTQGRLLAAAERRVGAVFAFAAGTGAELSGASTGAIADLERFGAELGVAYVLAEAVAELQAIAETRFSVSLALRQGIYSLPILLAAQEDRALAKSLMRQISTDELPGMVETLQRLGVIEGTRALIDLRLAVARDTLTDLRHPGGLEQLADWVGARAAATPVRSHA